MSAIDTIRITAALPVRNYRPGDQLPYDFWQGQDLKIDKDWCWLVPDALSNTPLAILLAAPAHGIVIGLRLWKQPDASPFLIRQLLRSMARDTKARGMTCYMLNVDATRPFELKLARLFQLAHGVLVPHSGFICCGRLEDLCRSYCL